MPYHTLPCQVISALRTTHAVVAYDMYGCGMSPKPDTPSAYSNAELQQDLRGATKSIYRTLARTTNPLFARLHRALALTTPPIKHHKPTIRTKPHQPHHQPQLYEMLAIWDNFFHPGDRVYIVAHSYGTHFAMQLALDLQLYQVSEGVGVRRMHGVAVSDV